MCKGLVFWGWAGFDPMGMHSGAWWLIGIKGWELWGMHIGVKMNYWERLMIPFALMRMTIIIVVGPFLYGLNKTS